MARPTKSQAARYPARSRDTSNLGDWLAQQAQQDTLRFITCGSVDDGKSTLIGRLLWESHYVFDDQMAALTADSKRHGTQGQNIDLALLVDGLTAEREQGITIDVAYRFFGTARRRFIVADTPGHEQYTRNMVTGASTADVAVILIDARKGLLTQTRRHTRLLSLMGVRHLALAINKMDLIGFDAKAFKRLEQDFANLAEGLQFDSVTAIPSSALLGDNVTTRSAHTPWYHGPTLLGYLETVQIPPATDQRVVFPVQFVNRPCSEFRGLGGSIASGRLAVGSTVRVTASGQTARVKRIVTPAGDASEALPGSAITLVLDKEVDASRGDILAEADNPLQLTDQFTATIIWMHEDKGMVGRSYELKLANQWQAHP